MSCLSGLHVVIVPSWWPSPEQPTAGVFFQDYVAAFAASGAKVGVLYPNLVSLRHLRRSTSIPLFPKMLHESTPGGTVIRVRGLHTALGRSAWQMNRFRAWLARALRVYEQANGRPDLLHAMCAIPAGWACTHLDDSLSRHVVVTEHTGPFSLALTPPAAARFVHEALAKAAAVVAVSERLRNQMKDAGIGRTIEVVGNPLAAGFLTAPLTPRANRLQDGDSRVLFVGRLTPEKGVPELIEAASQLKLRLRIRWEIVGDGPMREDLANQVRTAGLQESVQLHGACTRQRVSELMTQCDLFVLPTHGESFGLAVAEALCMALPVVTAKGSGCDALLQDGDGLVCDMNNAKDLARAVEEALVNDPQWNRLAIAESARRRFDGRAVATRYAEIYRRIKNADRE
jgi:glycosyltransferase involved in cell wall biosynthesis